MSRGVTRPRVASTAVDLLSLSVATRRFVPRKLPRALDVSHTRGLGADDADIAAALAAVLKVAVPGLRAVGTVSGSRSDCLAGPERLLQICDQLMATLGVIVTGPSGKASLPNRLAHRILGLDAHDQLSARLAAALGKVLGRRVRNGRTVT